MTSKALNLPFLAITGNYTMAATAQYQYVQATLTAPATLTLPDLALVLQGQPMYINNSASGFTLTVSATNGTIGPIGSLPVASGNSAFIVADVAAGTWRIQNVLGTSIATSGTSNDTAAAKWVGTGGNSITTSGVLIDASNNVTVPGNALMNTLGKGVQIKEGTNARQGTATLVAGTVTVSNTSITANSRIFICSNLDGGTPGWLQVSSKNVAGHAFTILSSNALDTSSVAWLISEGL